MGVSSTHTLVSLKLLLFLAIFLEHLSIALSLAQLLHHQHTSAPCHNPDVTVSFTCFKTDITSSLLEGMGEQGTTKTFCMCKIQLRVRELI